MERIFKGFIATGTGLGVSHSDPVAQVHWLQLTVWIATIFAGLATGACAIIRLWLDWKKRPTKGK